LQTKWDFARTNPARRYDIIWHCGQQSATRWLIVSLLLGYAIQMIREPRSRPSHARLLDDLSANHSFERRKGGAGRETIELTRADGLRAPASGGPRPQFGE
jgi:hypothetical protein